MLQAILLLTVLNILLSIFYLESKKVTFNKERMIFISCGIFLSITLIGGLLYLLFTSLLIIYHLGEYNIELSIIKNEEKDMYYHE